MDMLNFHINFYIFVLNSVKTQTLKSLQGCRQEGFSNKWDKISGPI